LIENLVIENWSLAIEFRLPIRSMAIYKFSTANSQWPSRSRFQSADSIMFDLRLEHPAAVSRSQPPGNPFREAVNMSKNMP